MSGEIRQNDVGTEIRVCIEDCDQNVVNLSGASLKQFVFKKPSGAILTKDALFFTDGSDGILSYVIASGDLNEIGTWQMQVHVNVDSNVWRSSFKSFKVHRNL